ncbi:MAG TPA: hypothetical protein VJ869_16185 [Sphaerochaeta sp.]|nr:hypothetical protein [Sphaerochaeta sp.]
MRLSFPIGINDLFRYKRRTFITAISIALSISMIVAWLPIRSSLKKDPPS